MSLIRALDENDQQEIDEILENRKEEINIRDDEGRTALHYAAEVSDLTTIERILEEASGILDEEDNNGITALMNALMVGRTEIASYLHSKGANVHHIDKDGHNLIHWTTVCGQLDALNWCLEKHVEVNVKDHTQEGLPIHYATVSDEIPIEVSQGILVTLLQHGALPNSQDRDFRTPILWCASNGNVEAMSALQNSGGDIQAKDRDQLGVLHCAASHGYHEVIDFVMLHVSKKMVDDQDRAGHTALFYAVTFGHYESALKLLQYGANPNHQDHRLRTPTHCAASKGQMRMLKLLKQYNASFNIQNYRGDTPFHEAVQSGSKDVVEWLLVMDSSVLDSPNHQGRTGLHLASAAGNLEIVILLCSKKCFVDPLMQMKGDVFTPLDIAKEQHHDVVVEYLTKLCNAKSKNDFSPKAIEEWKISFEQKMAIAKAERDAKMSQQKLGDKKTRPSTTSGIIEELKRENVDIGVNTTNRTSRSAQSTRIKPSLSKATSVTTLLQQGDLEKKLNELQNAEVDVAKAEDEEINAIDYLNVDEEFENLPTFSDSSTISELQSEIEENDEEEPNRKITVKQQRVSKAEVGNMKKKERKEVRISSDEEAGKKTKKKGKVVMRVRREPEIGSDGGDVNIYASEESGSSNFNEAQPSKSRYIHERAIFQELTHLKRMQIQYGKVQERVLVRSLVSNFCKMHNLDVNNFKFHTFYAWEKFLYDSLSEQLKIIYLDERERLNETQNDTKHSPVGLLFNKFDSRIRRSVPFREDARDMQRIYRNSRITSKSANRTKPQTSNGSKRCDCLEQHILL